MCIPYLQDRRPVDNYEVGITIMDDKGILQLNRDYWDQCLPMCCLFCYRASEEEPEIIEDGGENSLVLGDIIVSAQPLTG